MAPVSYAGGLLAGRGRGSGGLRSRVVAFAGAHGEAFAIGLDINLAIAAVGKRVAGGVGDEVLAAQFGADVNEGLLEIVHAVGEESPAAAFVRKLLKNLVAGIEMVFSRLVGIINGDPVRVGADGVYGDFGADGFFEGIAESVVAEIVVTIADDHENATNLSVRACRRRRIDQPLGSHVDGIIQSGSAAGSLAPDSVSQHPDIISEILDDLGFIVESHEKSHVFAMANDAGEEIDGGVLFELEAGADAVGGIEQETDAERHVGLTAEKKDFLRRTVFHNLEIALVQVRDEVPMAIHHSGNEVDEAGGGNDFGRLFLLER